MNLIPPLDVGKYFAFWHLPNPVRLASTLKNLFYERVINQSQRNDPSTVVDGYVWPGKVIEYLNDASRHYPTSELKLSDGSEISVAKTWITDIARIGNPDEFYIDDFKVETPPKTEEEIQSLLAKLLETAKGNKDLVRTWTEIWSYRPKMTLVSELMSQFKDYHDLLPVLGKDFERVVIRLKSIKEDEFLLTCEIEGTIKYATSEDVDIVEFKKPINYKGQLTYHSKIEEVKNQILFGDHECKEN
ncbi:MAG: hypothetical protein COT85_02770 [Chlamydiae bacterium CG10_big_fil_rev_8_21_14_0_10_42_34]|nr:MAG: hypothetical protein COT85_02770 [Chlamydiae bacterium CG10_big_fil_rev_8_21_14_0_10_42_34]